MDIFSSFATDETLENEGKWFPLSKTASVKVARSGNAKYLAFLRAKFKDLNFDFEDKSPENDQLAESVTLEVMAHTILVGWKGLTDKTGATVPYSTNQAKTYLAVKDFRKKVGGFADDFQSYRLKEEVAQGNA